MRDTRYWRALLAALLVTTPVSAAAGESESDWTARVRVEEGYTDNVRWAADGPQKEDAFFTNLGARAGWRNGRAAALPDVIEAGVDARLFSAFSDRDFVEVWTALEHEVYHTDLLAEYHYTPRRLELEDDTLAGNVYGSEHELSAGVQRRFLASRDLRLRALFEAEWENVREDFDERDSFTPAGVFDARYDVARLFVPRIEVRYGVRDADAANFDRDELDLGAGFDSYPRETLRLAVRYTRLMRDYTVGSEFDGAERNSNFDREDDADQVEVSLEWAVPRLEALRVDLKYRYRDNASTKSSRDFDVQEAGVSLTYSFD